MSNDVVEGMDALLGVVKAAQRLIPLGKAEDGSILIGAHGWYQLREELARLAQIGNLGRIPPMPA